MLILMEKNSVEVNIYLSSFPADILICRTLKWWQTRNILMQNNMPYNNHQDIRFTQILLKQCFLQHLKKLFLLKLIKFCLIQSHLLFHHSLNMNISSSTFWFRYQLDSPIVTVAKKKKKNQLPIQHLFPLFLPYRCWFSWGGKK